MAKLTKTIARDRQLNIEQLKEYNKAAIAYNRILPKLREYEDDEFITELRSELSELINAITKAKEEYEHYEDIIEYDVNTEDIETIRTAAENFLRMVSSK